MIKFLKRVDNSFWNTLRAEAHITVSTKLGYSNIVRMVGDAPKINLSPKKYINFGTVGISQTQKIMVELFNPTQHTVEVEIVGGIPAGSACANYIEENSSSSYFALKCCIFEHLLEKTNDPHILG